MKIIHTLPLFAFALLATSSRAGQVYWDTFTLSKASEHDGIYCSSLHTFDPIPSESFHLGIPATLFEYGSVLGNSFKNSNAYPSVMDADWAIVLFAESGDKLDWNYFASATSAYDNHVTRAGGRFASLTAPESTTASSVDYYEPFYMAMLYWYEDEDGAKPGYAWFELQATYDGLEMSQCATTLDEGLIVGTGQFATSTPEPSSGLLLLIGSVFLVLHRRKAA